MTRSGHGSNSVRRVFASHVLARGAKIRRQVRDKSPRAVRNRPLRVVKAWEASVSHDSAGRMNRSSPAIRSNRCLQCP